MPAVFQANGVVVKTRIIQSELLDGEKIVIVIRGTYEEAKEKYPDHVVYTPKEIESLKGEKPENIEHVHYIKKLFGGEYHSGEVPEKRKATIAEMREERALIHR